MAMISPELLRRYPTFSGIGEESLKQLAMISEEKSYRTGDVVFGRSEEANHLYMLIEGEVDLQSEVAGDRKTVDTLVGGDVMCWSAVVEPHRTKLSGVARQQTRAIAVEAVQLRELLRSDYQLGYRLMRSVASALSQRLEGAQIQLATRG